MSSFWRACGVPIAAVCAAATWPADARGEPTIWDITRDPQVGVEADAMRQSEVLIRKADRLERGDIMRRIAPDAEAAKVQRSRALPILEEAGARTSTDPRVLVRLADLLNELGDWRAAHPLYERALALAPSIEGGPGARPGSLGPLSSSIYSSLAVGEARLEHLKDDVRDYDRALDGQPNAEDRAFLFGNQAEGYLWLGDLPRAIAGYRASIATMPTYRSVESATSLWGLGVALDRFGDLGGALESIALARSYDPNDVLLRASNWTFMPSYDSDWYWALGALLSARHVESESLRLAQYDAAIAHYELFVSNAPKENPFIEIAKARIKQIEKERALAKKVALEAETSKPAEQSRKAIRPKLPALQPAPSMAGGPGALPALSPPIRTPLPRIDTSRTDAE